MSATYNLQPTIAGCPTAARVAGVQRTCFALARGWVGLTVGLGRAHAAVKLPCKRPQRFLLPDAEQFIDCIVPAAFQCFAPCSRSGQLGRRQGESLCPPPHTHTPTHTPPVLTFPLLFVTPSPLFVPADPLLNVRAGRVATTDARCDTAAGSNKYWCVTRNSQSALQLTPNTWAGMLSLSSG